MSSVSKRVALGLLTLVGVVLAGIGLWFSSHLGSEGSATFTARPSADRLVVLDPNLLNRVDSNVTITARGEDGAEIWIGRAAPSDATALVGESARQSVTGVSVTDWALRTQSAGDGSAAALDGADVWRQSVSDSGSATLTVSQADAPETVVIGTASGKPADLTSLEVTWENRSWALQSFVLILAGVLVAAAGIAGLWLSRRPAAALRVPGGRPSDARTPSAHDDPASPQSVDQPRREDTVALPAQGAAGREDTVALPRSEDAGHGVSGREDTVALPRSEDAGHGVSGREDTVALPATTSDAADDAAAAPGTSGPAEDSTDVPETPAHRREESA